MGQLEGRLRTECTRGTTCALGGESRQEFVKRVARVFTEAVRDSPALLVTHSGVIRLLLEFGGCIVPSHIPYATPIAVETFGDPGSEAGVWWEERTVPRNERR